ncbi:MAG: neutral zinc metallopeptidase [Chitinophagaceae bacterium]|nr:MAG: metalloprotease [Bacteroidetes bacterium OLB11]MCC6448759.1 neutral zinc metallopeptidase [Chitinophagaceae bacterium]HMN33226.1 neutral zinc metallopeptidase [Chitinophagaceae bacterium]
MKWQGRRESDNIEDRRGVSGRQVAIGGGGLSIVFLIVALLMGGNPQQLISDFLSSNITTTQTTGEYRESQSEKELKSYAAVTLADNEQVWTKIFAENGMTYEKPTMVIFSDETQSPCGKANAQTGPFYCPADQKVYLSLSFFNDLTQKLGAHGDFAFAYVIAHEVGHHVQNLLGTTTKMRKLQSQTNQAGANRLSVALELQADFLAGVWAHHNQQLNNVLEDGDIEEALSAANAVGDDRLQKQAQGYVVPDAFTHGTSEQRMYWFKKGYTTGDIRQGDTFKEVLR